MLRLSAAIVQRQTENMGKTRKKAATNERPMDRQRNLLTITKKPTENGQFIFENKDFKEIVRGLHKENMLKAYIDELGINLDESVPVGSEHCGSCKSLVTDEGISCQICGVWYHFGGCSSIDATYRDLIDNDNLWYVCNKCKGMDLSVLGKALENNNKMDKKLDELVSGSAILKDNIEVIQKKIDNVDRDMKSATNEQKTYAESVKSKKALIIKSKKQDYKIAQDKKELMKNADLPVEEVRETKEGHLYVRFKERNDMEKAKNKFEMDDQITVNVKGRLNPKIKVVNIEKDEDDSIDSILMKNRWLNSLIQEEEDFKLLKVVQARNKDYKHFIIKCTPSIRKAILDRGDKLYTLYRNCTVYDHYMPFRCYNCLGFGHRSSDCTKNRVCPKCSGNHDSKDCMSLNFKCNLCAEKGHDARHKAFETSKCTIYNNEIAKIRNNTDHGFD